MHLLILFFFASSPCRFARVGAAPLRNSGKWPGAKPMSSWLQSGRYRRLFYFSFILYFEELFVEHFAGALFR